MQKGGWSDNAPHQYLRPVSSGTQDWLHELCNMTQWLMGSCQTFIARWKWLNALMIDQSGGLCPFQSRQSLLCLSLTFQTVRAFSESYYCTNWVNSNDQDNQEETSEQPAFHCMEIAWETKLEQWFWQWLDVCEKCSAWDQFCGEAIFSA